MPRDIAARAAKVECDAGKSAYFSDQSVYLDFAEAIGRLGKDVVADRYGNLFDMYEEIIGDNPYDTPDDDLPRPPLHHGRAVGGLQPAEHHRGPVRGRRGQLLRPRRQPPGRQRPDAGPGRRLLRGAARGGQLPGRHQAGPGDHRQRRLRAPPRTMSASTSSGC